MPFCLRSSSVASFLSAELGLVSTRACFFCGCLPNFRTHRFGEKCIVPTRFASRALGGGVRDYASPARVRALTMVAISTRTSFKIFLFAFSLTAAGQSEGCHCCKGFDDCCLQTLIAHLRPVLPGRSSPSESRKTVVWQHLPASSAGPAPARLRGTRTADATLCLARFPRRSRIFRCAFFLFASGARLALFAGEAYAIETALAMTVLCWKSFVWEPKLADVALIRLPGSAVSFDALAADACRVFAFPLSDRIGIFVFVFCAFAAWPFFCVLSPQCFPVDRVASPQLQ